ncbi:MAG: glucokinase [Gammaproteobacteria bacterium RIFCSPHIGHO2_12_FULL_63_22]|nr:MAG: glucokinase [Gammaproteobacteria bacterium RIFCSPHIGHO2_12_FULL_63_22]
MNASLALVADIGGTNARFALADVSLAAPLLSDTIRQLSVTDFPSLVDAARHYLDALRPLAGEPRTGVFAVAGRVDGDEARITNHPWLISRKATAAALGFHSFHLVNDFTAQAMAVELLTDDDLAVIGDIARGGATAPSRTYAVIGPGTGLGVSGLVVRDGIAIALETEGGHVSFAPSNLEELEILRELSQDFGRVSDERLLSGGGLINIHRALSRLAGDAAPAALRPQDITERARRGDAGCARAVDVFCAVFGAIAGDLVLTLGAWDGVFLTGGLVPKLLPELQSGIFRERFEAKGRFSTAMAGVPTLAVIHPQAGLLGAAAHARNIIAPA